jgi:uncharacterized membrane protein
MSKRRANKAEAIVLGTGAMLMLVLLFVGTLVLPRILNGQSTDNMLRTMIMFIRAFVVLGGIITMIKLIVWFRVKKR